MCLFLEKKKGGWCSECLAGIHKERVNAESQEREWVTGGGGQGGWVAEQWRNKQRKAKDETEAGPWRERRRSLPPIWHPASSSVRFGVRPSPLCVGPVGLECAGEEASLFPPHPPTHPPILSFCLSWEHMTESIEQSKAGNSPEPNSRSLRASQPTDRLAGAHRTSSLANSRPATPDYLQSAEAQTKYLLIFAAELYRGGFGGAGGGGGCSMRLDSKLVPCHDTCGGVARQVPSFPIFIIIHAWIIQWQPLA